MASDLVVVRSRDVKDFHSHDLTKICKIIDCNNDDVWKVLNLELTLGTWEEGEEEDAESSLCERVDEDTALRTILINCAVRYVCVTEDGRSVWQYGYVSEVIDEGEDSTFIVQDSRDGTERVLKDIIDLSRVTYLSLAVGPCYGVDIEVWSSEACIVKEQLVREAIKRGHTTSREIEREINLQSSLGLSQRIRVCTQDGKHMEVLPRFIIDYYSYHVFESKTKARNFSTQFRDLLDESNMEPLVRRIAQSSRASSVGADNRIVSSERPNFDDLIEGMSVPTVSGDTNDIRGGLAPSGTGVETTRASLDQLGIRFSDANTGDSVRESTQHRDGLSSQEISSGVANFSSRMREGSRRPSAHNEVHHDAIPDVRGSQPSRARVNASEGPDIPEPSLSRTESFKDRVTKFQQVREMFGPDSEEWQRFWTSSTSHLSPGDKWALELEVLGDRAAMSSLVDVLAQGKKSNKLDFKPTDTQQLIHSQIVAPRHQGKHAMSYVETQVSHEAVVFKPEPGVLIRLYDFRFERWGLSITHLKPIDPQERREWGESSEVNLTDFSVSTKFSAKPVATHWDDVINALESLQLYGTEYYNAGTNTVIQLALQFARMVKLHERKMPVQISLVRSWIDESFAMYRDQLVMQRLDLEKIRHRFNIDNLEWVRETSVAMFRQLSQLGNRLDVAKPPNGPLGTFVPITAEMLTQIPQHNGKNLCLKFLSVGGCNKQADTCVNKDRAHFIPNSLSKELKHVITTRYGGIRADLSL